MDRKVDHYDTSYGHFAEEVQAAIRADTYDEDLGQSSWMTASELREFTNRISLDSASRLLEIGSGSGGPALEIAARTGCDVTGIDINELGVLNANTIARSRGLDSRVRFQEMDASRPLPFASSSFDAVFSNDALCHVPNRPGVFRECQRVLRPGGRLLFTDALVVTGVITHKEIAARSSIGHYLFVPPGVNEALMKEAGFEVLESEDLTMAAATVAKRWLAAREKHREKAVAVEGEENFEGLQGFLKTVHVLCHERRLSRFAYLARKPIAAAGCT